MVFVGKDDVRFDIAYLPLKLTKKYLFIYSFCKLLFDDPRKIHLLSMDIFFPFNDFQSGQKLRRIQQ
jgi:hypothetical protein